MNDEASDELVDYLRNDASGRRELDELVQQFSEMVHKNRFEFSIVCFYETRRTDFTKVIKKLPPEFTQDLDGDEAGIVRFAFS